VALESELSFLTDDNSALFARCVSLEDEVERLRIEIRTTAVEPSPNSVVSFRGTILSRQIVRKTSGASIRTIHNHTNRVSVISLTGSRAL
jgi:hypothetical protein